MLYGKLWWIPARVSATTVRIAKLGYFYIILMICANRRRSQEALEKSAWVRIPLLTLFFQMFDKTCENATFTCDA